MIPIQKTIKIFLADDDEDDRILFSEALSELPVNCKIFHYKDGIHLMAQLMIKETPLPDIIFLDINMPLMNGDDCLKKIRETERICKLPVFIYSTSFNKMEVGRFHTLGANGYLQKPTSFNQLKTLLYKCIKPYSHGANEEIATSFIIQV